jgi:hypothetical protein
MRVVHQPNRYQQIPNPDEISNPISDPGQDTIRNPAESPAVNPDFWPFGGIDCIPFSQINLVNTMRYLWLQLVSWSRPYLCCSSSKEEAKPVIYERLHSVPAGFFNYISTFFGQAIAEQFIHLMSRHVILFADLIEAMISGNQQEANRSQSEWYGNAAEIAAFLARINETWNYYQWQDLLGRLIRMHIEEAVAILSADYQREIAIYDRLQYHSLLMADYMSRGVIRSLQNHTGDRSGIGNQGFCKG